VNVPEKYFWVNNPDYRIFKREDPNNPEWCVVAAPFVEWGDGLINRLMQDPVPGKVGFAKWKLLDRYVRLHQKTTNMHRPEVNGGEHPCIHRALLEIWQKIEDLEIQAAIPELEPPQLRVLPSPSHPVVEAPDQEDEPLEEVTGIIIGVKDEPPGEHDEKNRGS
jgi:hypothetical protein